MEIRINLLLIKRNFRFRIQCATLMWKQLFHLPVRMCDADAEILFLLNSLNPLQSSCMLMKGYGGFEQRTTGRVATTFDF